MNLREKLTASAVASPSSLAPVGKERDVETGGCHVVAASPLLSGNAKTAAPEAETEINAGVGGCSWMASDAPPASAATGLVVVEGF